jgi:hypothetical protein
MTDSPERRQSPSRYDCFKSTYTQSDSRKDLESRITPTITIVKAHLKVESMSPFACYNPLGQPFPAPKPLWKAGILMSTCVQAPRPPQTGCPETVLNEERRNETMPEPNTHLCEQGLHSQNVRKE